RILSGRKAVPQGPVPECFVGRKDDLAPLIRCLREPGRPAAIAITGDSGMGKSAFLRRVALEAGILGYRAVSVRCYVEGTAPFEPLRAIAAELIPTGVSGRALRSRYHRLLEEPQAKSGGGIEDSSGRRIFVKALRDLFLEAALPGPFLLLIDDLHLADPL